MSMSLDARLDEQVKIYVAAAGLALTSTLGDTKYVSMKGYNRCAIIMSIADGTTITGCTVTLKQATAIAGTSEKALAFTRMLSNVDYAVPATSVLAETAVTSNTFTSQTTNSKDSVYVIDVKAEDLDVAGGFDCIRLDGTGHAATAMRGSAVIYLMYGARHSGLLADVD